MSDTGRLAIEEMVSDLGNPLAAVADSLLLNIEQTTNSERRAFTLHIFAAEDEVTRLTGHADADGPEPVIDPRTLETYADYVREIDSVMTDRAVRYVSAYGGDPARVARYARAHARLRFGDEVTADDAIRAAEVLAGAYETGDSD